MVVSILGAGWLGKALIPVLKEKGHTVNASTRTYTNTSDLESLGANVFLIDYSNDKGTIGNVAFFDCDCLVICMAPGKINSVESNYPEALKVYLDLALEYSVRKIIFTSSSGIYGEMEGLVDEEIALKATHNDSSALRLLQAENLLLNIQKIDCYILRLAGLIGPGRQAGSFLAGKKNLLNPNAPVNLVEQSDVVAIISKFIDHTYPNGIYNVCMDEHPSRNEFYSKQAKLLGLEVPEFMAFDTSKGRIVSNEKVKRLLGFKFMKLD